MPQATPLSVTDSNSNTLVYTPHGETDGVWRFTSPDASGAPVGDSTLAVSVRKAPNVTRVRVKLDIPRVVNEVVNGVSNPKAGIVNTVDCTFTVSNRSTPLEREDLLAILQALFANANVNETIADLRAFY